MSKHKVPQRCAWAFVDIHQRLTRAKAHVRPMVLRPGDHMPSRLGLITDASQAAIAIEEALRLIAEVYPQAAQQNAVRSNNDI